jgi:hypothetical protein
MGKKAVGKNIKERDHMQDLGANWRTASKRSINKDLTVWNEFIWLQINKRILSTSGGSTDREALIGCFSVLILYHVQ